MSRNIVVPTYKEGFATCAAESANPGLWKDCVGLWSPSLGPTGLTLHDWSPGKKNHGTLTNIPPATAWGLTEMGWGVKHAGEGSGDYIELETPIALGTQPWAFSCWADIDSLYVSWGGLFGYDFTAGKYTRILIGSASPYYYLYNDANGTSTQTFAFAVTGLHHYFIQHDGAKYTLYRDAVQLGVPTALAGPFTIWRLGNYGASGAAVDSMDGRLINTGIWGRAVMPEEIQQLYADPYAMFRPRPLVLPAAVAPPVGAIMNQIQKANLGADLFDGALIA